MIPRRAHRGTSQKTEWTEQAIRKNEEKIRRFRRDFLQAPKGFVMISSSPLCTAGRRTFLHVLRRGKENRDRPGFVFHVSFGTAPDGFGPVPARPPRTAFHGSGPEAA